MSYGIFGLIDAIDKFDNMKEVKFETYASLRIRDSRITFFSFSVRISSVSVNTRFSSSRSILSSGPSNRVVLCQEIAGKLGITDEEYLEWQSQMKITNVVSLNEYMEQGSEVPLEVRHIYRRADACT